MATKLTNKSDAEFMAIITRRRTARMRTIDALPPDIRACVHDYGWTTVSAFLDIGVTKARHIRHLVDTVLNEFSPTRGSSSAQGIRAALGIRSTDPLAQQERAP